MENVYNIEKSPIFEEVLAIFKSAGYGVTKHIWDASYMGVPQMRRRYFVVGKLGEYTNGVLSVYTPPLPRADGRGGVNEMDYPMTTNLLSGKSYLTG